MIAFFVPTLEEAAVIARGFTSMTRETDGPWRLYKGRLKGHRASCFVVTEGADSAWAAARLAIHRGARTLLPITHSFTEEGLAEEYEMPFGTVLRLGRIWNYSGLVPLLRLLPDSAARLPIELDPLLPETPVFEDEDPSGPALATLPFQVSNPTFLRHLHTQCGVSCFDLQMSGYAEALADSEKRVRLLPSTIICGIATGTGMKFSSSLMIGRAFEGQLADLLSG